MKSKKNNTNEQMNLKNNTNEQMNLFTKQKQTQRHRKQTYD